MKTLAKSGRQKRLCCWGLEDDTAHPFLPLLLAIVSYYYYHCWRRAPWWSPICFGKHFSCSKTNFRLQNPTMTPVGRQVRVRSSFFFYYNQLPLQLAVSITIAFSTKILLQKKHKTNETLSTGGRVISLYAKPEISILFLPKIYRIKKNEKRKVIYKVFY